MWTLFFILKVEGNITVVSQKWVYHSWACDRLVVRTSPEHWLERLGSHPQFTWSSAASANSVSPKMANTSSLSRGWWQLWGRDAEREHCWRLRWGNAESQTRRWGRCWCATKTASSLGNMVLLNRTSSHQYTLSDQLMWAEYCGTVEGQLRRRKFKVNQLGEERL